MWQKFNALYKYTKIHARPSSNNSRAMDRVQMLNNPLQYLKARNAAYKAVAASADAVCHGALYQIACSICHSRSAC